MQDKRDSKRLDIHLTAIFRAPDVDDGICFASTVDLSASGLCLLTKVKLNQGQKWPFELVLPTDERILLKTEIVWIEEWDVLVSTEYKAGVKLTDAITPTIARYAKFYNEKLREAVCSKDDIQKVSKPSLNLDA